MQENIKLLILLPLSCFTIVSASSENNNPAWKSIRKFPSGFLFGTATGSYQVEGGWNADGKSENIWDHMTHKEPCSIKDCTNGDIADDSYNLYKRDVEMMRELGLDFYRLSISWSRLMPTSFPDKVNEAGLQYYNNLINEMLKYNIQPVITLYHWDLPQRLQDLGGWANPYITDWFTDYARVAFENFGDRVKYWITINEPREICLQGYGDVTKAPRLNAKGTGEYMCSKNLLIAHAKVYHLYRDNFKEKWGGVVGIALSATWYEPASHIDFDATETLREFEMGQYIHPIFSETGDYPEIMRKNIAAKSAAQGFHRSRLPQFTTEEVKLITGSSDFLGLNHYTSYYTRLNVSGKFDVPSYWDDIEATRYQLDEWQTSASSWLKVVPWGFYKLLNHIREQYNNPTIFITENGLSSRGGLNDEDRISYYRSYLNAMLDAMDDGSDIMGYTAWSLMDNFEWMQGYTERFGLYEVDFESSERTRTPRKSAFVYKEIVRTRTLDPYYEPNTTVMSIDEGH